MHTCTHASAYKPFVCNLDRGDMVIIEHGKPLTVEQIPAYRTAMTASPSSPAGLGAESSRYRLRSLENRKARIVLPNSLVRAYANESLPIGQL